MKTSTRFIVPLLLAVLAACGGNPSNPDAGPVTITPEAVTVKAGDSTPFTATVEGATQSKVLWSVEGGSAHGTITSDGVYTAPATAGTYTVVATNAVDTSKQDTATVTVTPATVVTITPANPSVGTRGSIAFTAQVTGAQDTSVTWSVQDAAGGTITDAGVYTAPATAGLYTVVATSKADPTRKATTLVRVETVAVTVSPPSVSLDAGGVAEFKAQVTGSTDTSVEWSVEGGAASGTITASGIYTAPAAAGLYTVVATSKADPSKKGSATVSVRSVSVSLSPASQTVNTHGTVAFYAQVTGSSSSSAVTWSVEGGVASGTITAAGVYTAPGTAGTYTVTATSVADPTKKASATVTVVAVGLTVAPSTVTLEQGAVTVFKADVTGSDNKAVSWSVSGGDANGTITGSGIYTAPNHAGTFTVVATSAADPSQKASATVTVAAITLTVTPGTQAVAQGASVTFSATVTGTVNKAVSWSVEGGNASGTITSEGVYTAPFKTGTFMVVATSAADPGKKATATVTVTGATGASYQDPAGTGWRLVKNTSASSGNRIVLDLVGPEGESGRGVDLTLAVEPTLAFWEKVDAADPEPVRNLKYTLGSAPQYLKGSIQSGTLKVGVFQKGTTAPATPYSGGLISVAITVKVGASVPTGSVIPLTVVKAHALPATSNLAPISVAVGTLTAN